MTTLGGTAKAPNYYSVRGQYRPNRNGLAETNLTTVCRFDELGQDSGEGHREVTRHEKARHTQQSKHPRWRLLERLRAVPRQESRNRDHSVLPLES